MNALVQVPANGHEFRQSTDAAGFCRDIVQQTAKPIQGRRFVSCEGWQAIAIAHGCAAGARDVERVEGGVRAIGEVRRMSDGQVIATAEGFVGEDEAVWFGGKMRKWKWGQRRGEKVWYDEDMPKRPDYAIRAMAQTRAISRACRSAFAHVVVMIDAGLSTTPAEEVPDGGFVDAQYDEVRDDTRRDAGNGTERPQQSRRRADPDEGMPAAAWAELVQLIEAVNADTGKMLKHFGVADLKQLSSDQHREAVAKLKDELAAMAKAETNRNADIGEDSIPY
ncbi:hypothetical protein [Novosphingobium colocasiae]|uniref:hypothetical protein n=1 Tax=Novosphingobium colocasiae TaxID=1256513 RepID=UPI0035B36C58